tara:strand:+ start:1693 stop:1959 length:267 start_codon:yes stop_codon:yes gene_type:complete
MANKMLNHFTNYVNAINNDWSDKECDRYLKVFSNYGTPKTVLISTLIKMKKENPPYQGIIHTQLFEKIFKPMRENKKIPNAILNQDWF